MTVREMAMSTETTGSTMCEGMYTKLIDRDNGPYFEESDSQLSRQDAQHTVFVSAVRGGSRASGARPYRLATACLTAFCLVLLMSLVVMSVHYKNSLQDVNGKQSALSQNSSSWAGTLAQTMGVNVSALTEDLRRAEREKSALEKERDQLQARVAELERTPAPVTSSSLTCSDGWLQFKSTCYYISTQRRTWQSSQDYCTKQGGHLAILRTEDVQTFLWDQLPRGHWNTWWFGMSDKKAEGDWLWVDGTKLEKSFWQEGEPNNHNHNEDCGYIVKTDVLSRVATSSWNDAPCSMSVSWICEKPVTGSTPASLTPAPVTPAPVTPAPLNPAPQSCPPDWLVFNSSCYFISSRSKDWEDSQTFCQERGGHLAIIHTAEEQTFLWKQLPRGHWNAYWFGISDATAEADWLWVDGTKLEGGFWEVGEPNNHIDEDCGYIVKTRVLSRVATRSWYDAPCSMYWPWICEIELKPASASH